LLQFLAKLFARISEKTTKVFSRAVLPGRNFPSPIDTPYANLKESLESFQEEGPTEYNGDVLLGKHLIINSFGLTFKQWLIHFWIQKLPLIGLSFDQSINSGNNIYSIALIQNGNHDGDPSIKNIGINFHLPLEEDYQEWLLALRKQQLIWDPDPSRVCLLRSMGLPAYWLNPNRISNGWLQQSWANDSNLWESQLGLSIPKQGNIVILGHAGMEWDISLAKGSFKHFKGLQKSIAYFPGWDEIIIENQIDCFIQSVWLANIDLIVKDLVWINPVDWIEVDSLKLFFNSPIVLRKQINPFELFEELDGLSFQAFTEERFVLQFDRMYSWQSSVQPEVAVVISLYNYADRIIEALQSVYSQSQSNIELIVVDDASDDSGIALVKAWMMNCSLKNHDKFSRLLLLRHKQNHGLAATRNTAFHASISKWCFVLDADNELLPDALEECYQIASVASENLAVVHPLLLVESEKGREDDQRSLVGLAPWQKKRLKSENTVDAMALIRHDAWKRVGGFTHIEGGWEDYDFWCKLIDAGFYGVQCPKILAIYRSHNESMSHSFTNRSWRALSRALLSRHPWMNPRALSES